MKKRRPASRDIDELVSFLPRLSAEGFAPVKTWGGGEKNENGAIEMPWPEYDETVLQFFELASQEIWTDRDYKPDDAGRMIENDDFIKTADIAQIRTMLTYCVRGERFCDGHWEEMIQNGTIRRLLQRLAELGSGEA